MQQKQRQSCLLSTYHCAPCDLPGLGKQSVFAHATGCHPPSWTSSARPVDLAGTVFAAGLALSIRPPEQPGDFSMLWAAELPPSRWHEHLLEAGVCATAGTSNRLGR